MASAGQQIRIAIALTALRHKPSEQSIQAYVFDLQAVFSTCGPGEQPPRPPSPNPWRERVLALEKDLQHLKSQHDKDRLELLELRKAAKSNQSNKTVRDARDQTSDTSTTASAPPAAKKAKTKKNKPSSPAVDLLASASTPLLASNLERDAVLDGPLADTPVTSNITMVLEAFDMMTQLLAANPRSASVDLLLSTSMRTLRALGEVLSLATSSYLSLTPDPSAKSGSRLKIRNAVSTLRSLDSLLNRLISTVISALLAHYRAYGKQASINKTVMGRTRCSQARDAVANAIDEVLGSIYSLCLVPIVRSFGPLSEGFLSACFTLCLDPVASRTESSSSATARKGLAPRSSVADLRPTLLSLVENSLCTLESILGGSSGMPAGAFPFFLHTSTGSAKDVVIPGVCHVKTLLALECVRELAKLYALPVEEPAAPSAAELSGAKPGPHEDTRCQHSPHAQPHARRFLRAGMDEDPTRPGTSPSLSTSLALAGLPSFSGTDLTDLGWTRLPYRTAAGNFGEIGVGATSDPARGPVQDANVNSVRRATASSSSSPGSRERGLGPGADSSDPRAKTRIARLARKDAVWYLCAALQRLLPLPSTDDDQVVPTPAPSASPSNAPPTPPFSAPSTDTSPSPTNINTHTYRAAEQAVYDALADLLRRTRPPPALPLASRLAQLSASSSSSSSPGFSSRGHAPDASNHDHGSAGCMDPPLLSPSGSPSEGDGAESQRVSLGNGGPTTSTLTLSLSPGRSAVPMGEVERGMLLAVLERAWLGV